MNEIKGPITFGKSIPTEILGDMKLPFEAKNWKSSKNEELVKVKKDDVESVEKKEEEVKKVETSERKYVKEDLSNLSLKELKKIGKQFNVTDRSKTRLIKEILKAQ